jgi:hypothetical protein
MMKVKEMLGHDLWEKCINIVENAIVKSMMGRRVYCKLKAVPSHPSYL